MSRIALASSVVVEDLGSDLMVKVPGSTEVITLSGDAAEAVRLVQSGSLVATDAVVSDLVRLGVLETSGLSRRGLIKAGAIGAGAGISVMAMPGVAAASSSGVPLEAILTLRAVGSSTFDLTFFRPLPFEIVEGDDNEAGTLIKLSGGREQSIGLVIDNQAETDGFIFDSGGADPAAVAAAFVGDGITAPGQFQFVFKGVTYSLIPPAV